MAARGSSSSEPEATPSEPKTTPMESETTPMESKTPAGGKERVPAPNMEERIEGLQGWMAEIEKKQQRSTRFAGGAAILAVLAAGGALALGLMNQQNSASDDDLDKLTEQVNELGTSVKSQTEKGLTQINGRLQAVEERIAEVELKQTKQATQIQELESRPVPVPAQGAADTGVKPATPDSKP